MRDQKAWSSDGIRGQDFLTAAYISSFRWIKWCICDWPTTEKYCMTVAIFTSGVFCFSDFKYSLCLQKIINAPHQRFVFFMV